MVKDRLRRFVVGTPLEPVARAAWTLFARSEPPAFTTSGSYWETRYAGGGNSGSGSYGRLADYKASVLNDFVARNGVTSVIEFGCGDGNQLTLADYPSYLGVDVARTAVSACEARFRGDATKSFVTLADYDGRAADLALSLDVIFHLVEDETYFSYMERLFDAAGRFVIIYSSNRDEQPEARHVRHRAFKGWIEAERPDFRLAAHLPNPYPFDEADPDNTSEADFYIFERSG